MNFLKKYWLWLVVAVAVWFFLKTKRPAQPTGSAASAVSDAVQRGIAGLSTAWADAQKALGLA